MILSEVPAVFCVYILYDSDSEFLSDTWHRMIRNKSLDHLDLAKPLNWLCFVVAFQLTFCVYIEDEYDMTSCCWMISCSYHSNCWDHRFLAQWLGQIWRNKTGRDLYYGRFVDDNQICTCCRTFYHEACRVSLGCLRQATHLLKV